MANKKRSVLNQIFEKTKVEPKEEIVEELTQEDMDMDKYDMTVHSNVHPPVEESKIIIGDNEVAMKPTKKVEESKIVFSNKPIEINLLPEDEAAPRTIESLSKKEYRWFLRTGTMPK